MTLPADLAAFITMLLRGCQLAAQSLLIGGLAFLVALARPLAPALQGAGPQLLEKSRLWAGRAGLLLALVAALSVGINLINLNQTLGLSLAQALGADFIAWTALAVLGGLSAWLWLRVARGPLAGLLLLGSVAAVLAAALMSSHAAARLDQRAFYMTADALHQIGAAVWIGGIPFMLLGLAMVTPAGKALVGARFSHMSMGAVTLLAIGATIMAIGYSGSWAAFIGTAYGAMMATKLFLLGVLLLMGLMNMLTTRDPASDPEMVRLRNFAEVEIGIGIAVMFIAASLATQPPAADQASDPSSLASFHEIVERMTPTVPRLVGPSHDQVTIPTDQLVAANFESSDADKAWSEVNHHWAGIFLLTLSLLALLERTGKAPWARNWPLMFLLLAGMLFVRSDPESWPLGPIPFWERFMDPEVMQHRLVMLLLVPFGLFEWSVRTGRLTRPWASMVFPALCVLGGTLRLAHTHSLTDVKQSYLIELNHLPMGACGILAGWARWLELRGPKPERRLSLAGSGAEASPQLWPVKMASWIWPICFMMIGFLLLDYRES
jgi:putative copper resistance protein D